MSIRSSILRAPDVNLDAQEGLIGCALLGASEDISGSGISTASFIDPKCRQVWVAIEKLIDENKEVNTVTVHSETKLDPLWLGALPDKGPTALNWTYHLQNVKESCGRHQLWELCQMAASHATAGNSPSEITAELEAGLLRANGAASHIHESGSDDWKEFCDLLADAGRGTASNGLSTGFLAIDAFLRGLRGGTMNTVAGRPGTGKSALAANIAMSVAKSGGKVLVFSAEMKTAEYIARLVAIESGEDVQGYLSNGWMDSAEPIADAVKLCHKLPIGIVDSTTIHTSAMRSYARKVAKTKLDLVIVDYLQLYRPPGKSYSRENEVSQVSRAMKLLAMECDVPVIVACQMNRAIEGRESEPRLSDLRESGSIEQDSDTVSFLWRDEKAQQLKFCLKKNRTGPTGNVGLEFTPYCQRFRELPSINE
jgi:replicative DNA helicase